MHPEFAADYYLDDAAASVIPNQLETRARSELSQLLLQGSFNEILVVDLATARISESNRAARSNLQYTLQELKQLGLRDLFINDRGRAWDPGRTALKAGPGGIQAFDSRLRRKDGTRYRAEVRLFSTQDRGRPLLVAIVHDMTQRDAARQAIEQRDADYQALVSHIPGMAYQVRRAPDGQVSLPFVSANSRLLLGVKPRVLQANPGLLQQLIIPEDLPSYQAGLDAADGCPLCFNWEGRIWVEAWKDVKWINIRASRRETAGGTVWDGIMLNITQSRQAKAELERSREELRKLALHIQRVKEEERKRIAQEVHDELGGNLTAIKIGVSWLARHGRRDQEKCEDRLKFLDEVVDNTLDAIHRIASDLRPSVLDFGIVSALRWQTEQLCRSAGIDCRFFTKLGQVALDDETSVAVFRIAQEALTNIAKHARATCVEVSLGVCQGRLCLEIRDDGIGPKRAGSRSRGRALGVVGMTERASALGGRFTLLPAEGGGSLARLELPLMTSPAAGAGEADPARSKPRRKTLKSALKVDV
jgi:PAS domain S-box-containing protein